MAEAGWSDAALLRRVRAQVLPLIERQGAIAACIVDDSGFLKKAPPVGVARQYCGRAGKQDNCEVAVTRSVANAQAGVPVAHRLYMPEALADDPLRRPRRTSLR